MRILSMVILVAASCAGARSMSGVGGGAAVSGEAESEASITGAGTDEPATNGPDNTGSALPSPARPGVAVSPAQQ
jgi:hypothetical protein